MELDEMKELWKQYDDKLNNYNMVNEKMISQMMKEKSHDQIGRIMNIEYLSLAVSGLVMMVFLLRAASINYTNTALAVSYWVTVFLFGVCTAWYAYKLHFLQNTDLGNQSVLDATERMQRFRFMIAREKIWAFILMPFIMAAAVAVLFKWIHNIDVFVHWQGFALKIVLGYIFGVVLSYWAYGKLYFRNIKQIIANLNQIREFREN